MLELYWIDSGSIFWQEILLSFYEWMNVCSANKWKILLLLLRNTYYYLEEEKEYNDLLLRDSIIFHMFFVSFCLIYINRAESSYG